MVTPHGYADVAVIRRLSGTRVCARDELTGALSERGLIAVDQRVAGMAQFVAARAPR
jgi:hypothetical protein